MQINAQKSKVMVFHETPAQKRKHKGQIKCTRLDSQPTYPPSFHIVTSFPSHRQCSHLIEEVQEFDYLGLRLDPKIKMTSALHRIQEKVNKSNALVFAVSHSLRYDDSSHRHRPPQRNPHPSIKPLESMRIATPTPKSAVSQREPRRQSAGHPEFIVETHVARLWPHRCPLHRYGRTPPPTDSASAVSATTF